jgi:hypothetical protein
MKNPSAPQFQGEAQALRVEAVTAPKQWVIQS